MRARYLLLISAVFGSILIAPASALPVQVKSVDAPWVYFYADSSIGNQIAKEPIPRTFSVEKALTKSSFKVELRFCGSANPMPVF